MEIMAKTHLTKRAIDAATYEGKDNSRDVRWDDEIAGFGLRVYPSGKKAFVLKYRDGQGTQCMLTIGDYGVFTLDGARAFAREKLVEVAKGTSPVEVRKELLRGDTVADLAMAFLAHVKAPTPTKPNGQASAYDTERRVMKVLIPAWGTRKLVTITNDDMAAMKATYDVRKKFTEGNRVRALVSAMWNYGYIHKYVPPSAPNPVVGVAMTQEVSRDRYVTPEELPRLMQAIENCPNIYIRAIIWLYLLTANRKSELMTAKWEHFDELDATLMVFDTKNGTNQLVQLSTHAMAVIKQVPRMVGNPYMFPGAKEGKHLVNLYKSWANVLREAKVSGVRIHDLRRTVGSYMAQAGVSIQLIGKVLNHKTMKTTAVYARHAQQDVRDALEQHGDRVSAIRRGGRTARGS